MSFDDPFPSSARFVLLWHDLTDASVEFAGEGTRHSHFDLMIERGSYLATWELPVALSPDKPSQAVVERLANHRLRYLDYEGPISRNRGHVTRKAWGTYRTRLKAPDFWELDLEGSVIHANQEVPLAGRLMLNVNQVCSLNLLDLNDLDAEPPDNALVQAATSQPVPWGYNWAPQS